MAPNSAAAPEPRVFRCVPFNQGWTINGRHNVKAIYRRPARAVGEYDEVIRLRRPDGLPLWDVCGPLPMNRHADWARKGYEYVTVATPADPLDTVWKDLVVPWLRHNGLNPSDYIQHPVFGTWNPKLYLATADDADRVRFDGLRAMVEKVGSEAVIAVRRMTDPTFELPEPLQNVPPGGRGEHAA